MLSRPGPGYNPTLKGKIRQIKKARDLIKQAKKPMILAGAGEIISCGVLGSLLRKSLEKRNLFDRLK